MLDSTCRTCCKPLSAPYRVYDERGRAIQGCVAADHDGHVHGYESVRWHNRPEAKAIRKATADHLKTILAPKRRNRAITANNRAA